MVPTEHSNQLISTIGKDTKRHVHTTQIVMELNKYVQSYFGKLKMMEVRPMLLDLLVMIGHPVHALVRNSFQLRIRTMK